MDINTSSQPSEPSSGEKTTIGSEAEIRFLSFNKSVKGKVDTGATTSSLHAVNIKVGNGQVSFQSPVLSNNVITLETNGHQEVHSADGGGQQRPTVELEVEVGGKHIGPVQFNLNDRSNMDNEILIGQNILKAGNFIIDVQQDSQDGEDATAPMLPSDNTERIREAIRVLRDSDITLTEIMKYIQTEAVSKLEY